MGELHDLSAREQAEAIRAGNLSPVELTEHYLERIDRWDDTLGAFLTRTHRLAREQAFAAERAALTARREGAELPPLHGVPVPVKDLHHVAGVRCTMGSRALVSFVPTVDDHVAAKLRAGGTIMLGKTNTPEFGLPCYTENHLAPPARSPWDTERSAGGSSGGAAAAVAAGLAPVAHASDGGGSVRIPASACGLFGIKPSRGRISGGPLRHDVTGLATSGPLARTVADAATLLDVMSGTEPGDPYAAPAPPPGETFAGYAEGEVRRLRIGCVVQPPISGAQLHPECRTAVTDTAALLSDLGHQVDEVTLPTDDGMLLAFARAWSVMAASLPLPPGSEDLLMPLTRYLRRRGAQVSGTEFSGALYTFRALAQRLADELMAPGAGYDVLLSPTVTAPSPLVGAVRNDADPQAEFATIGAFAPYTALYNATGQPAVSLPLHWSADNGPIGVMCAGRYGDEATLIALSAQLERARPWAGRTPDMW